MKSDRQNRDAELLTLISFIGIIIVLTIILFTSCSKKVHVITEQDGDRTINWYSK